MTWLLDCGTLHGEDDRGMGKVRRSGYIITWWKGDHEPCHVHVKTSSGKKLGRLDIATMRGLEGWLPNRKLTQLIEQLKNEGRL